MTVTIEKGIPLPGKLGTKNSNKYGAIPWTQMEVGDSFVFEATGVAYMKHAARKHGVTIFIKTLSKGRYRVWRIETPPEVKRL